MVTGRPAAVLLLILLAAGAAGCGGDAPAAELASLEGATTTTPAPAEAAAAQTLDLEEALLAFSACMREEGVDFPDPQVDAQGNLELVSLMAQAGRLVSDAGDEQALRDAANACRGHLAGVVLRFASLDRTEMEDRLLAYAGCMREHGFDLPDPDFSTGRPGLGGPFPGVGRDIFEDPDFLEANESCQGIFAGLMDGPDGLLEGD
jgi:hypothetical protein